MGSVARSQGNYGRATQLHEEALTLFREVGNKLAVAYALRNLGLTAFAQADYEQAVKKFEEALVIGREAGDKFEIAFALYGMGKVAQSQGDFALARELNLEAIVIFQGINNPADVAQGVAHCLEVFAFLAVTQKQMKRAAYLLSVSQKFYAPLRFEMSAAERAEHDQLIAAALAALGEDAFTEAWAEGRIMTIDEAVAYALKEL